MKIRGKEENLWESLPSSSRLAPGIELRLGMILSLSPSAWWPCRGLEVGLWVQKGGCRASTLRCREQGLSACTSCLSLAWAVVEVAF